MEWQVELYTLPLSGNKKPSPEELADSVAAKLSSVDILRDVGVVAGSHGAFQEILIVVYMGDADDIEQAASDLVPPGVKALEETLGSAGHPVGIHMLEMLSGDMERISRPDRPPRWD